MKALRRVFLFLWALILIFLGVSLLFCLANSALQSNLSWFIEGFLFSRSYLAATVCISICLILLGIFHFILSASRGQGKERTLAMATISSGESGDIQISLQALDNLIQRAAQGVQGIVDTKNKIKPVDSGIAIYIQAGVKPDISIPDTTVSLQQEVKQHLETMAGVKVLEIKVLVNTIAAESKVKATSF
ncbi:MAG: alkaline shock response membrane anchor protein AmaP [Clostridiales bacterium]|jgi:uncharacterized alkaline shock family protein YloU|nr:alkaline shock response membrane anchor protein AmaP [Clostridiales bacterium]MDR2713362.1 alkaline shock response membrane anchor protein AmaP [Clostridiales bacterium]